jgi:hypothetical protein
MGFKYLVRDYQILVLIEESAAALFDAFPYLFILFGGVTLVLFHDGLRLSRDLDLIVPPGYVPDYEEIQKVGTFRHTANRRNPGTWTTRISAGCGRADPSKAMGAG